MEKISNWIIKNWKIAFFVMLVASIMTINFTRARFKIDIILISVFLIIALLGRIFTSVKDWIPTAFLFWIYEFTRGIANTLNQHLSRPVLVEEIVNIERKLFFFLKDIPNVLLQNALHPDNQSRWFDQVLFFFYSSFYWVWIGVGFVIWKWKEKRYFYKYIYGLIGFSIFCNIIYFLFPTAPPWYAAQEGFINPITRILWNTDILAKSGLSAIHLLDDNPFAALPSLHTGWTWYAALFATKMFGWKKAGWFFVFPILIMFAIVYGAEHYIVDIIAGITVSTFAFWIVTKEKSKSKDQISKL